MHPPPATDSSLTGHLASLSVTPNLSLTDLPPELLEHVASFVKDPDIAAALCAAHARLGLAALRVLDQHQRPLAAVAWQLLTAPNFKIDDPLLRRYAADPLATVDGCAWLANAVAVWDHTLTDPSSKRNLRKMQEQLAKSRAAAEAQKDADLAGTVDGAAYAEMFEHQARVAAACGGRYTAAAHDPGLADAANDNFRLDEECLNATGGKVNGNTLRVRPLQTTPRSWKHQVERFASSAGSTSHSLTLPFSV